MFDPFILATPSFRLIEEGFESAIQQDPTYICHICWVSVIAFVVSVCRVLLCY